MRISLLILIFFIMGVVLGKLDVLPALFLDEDISLFALWILMALVGVSVGADKNLFEILRSLNLKILLLPLATTLGTFSGAVAASLFVAWTITDCLAVGAGFGYYSLSSIFITRYLGPDLGTIALIGNIARELFTLLCAPLVFRIFGAPAAISCGGATTMDTTLPILTQACGNRWVFPAIIHAMILDFSVPFWVTFFCSL